MSKIQSFTAVTLAGQWAEEIRKVDAVIDHVKNSQVESCVLKVGGAPHQIDLLHFEEGNKARTQFDLMQLLIEYRDTLVEDVEGFLELAHREPPSKVMNFEPSPEMLLIVEKQYAQAVESLTEKLGKDVYGEPEA